MKTGVALATVFAILIPLAIFWECVLYKSPSILAYSMWIFFAVLCLAWGLGVMSRSRLGGWSCIAVALSQFGLQLLPLFTKAK
jgi:hypothetical protein